MNKLEHASELMFDLTLRLGSRGVDDVDSTWQALADVLRSMRYSVPPDFQPRPKKGAQLAPVIEAIGESAGWPGLKDLSALVEEMEELSRTSSNRAVNEKDMKKLAELTVPFEKKFSAFLEKLEEIVDEDS